MRRLAHAVRFSLPPLAFILLAVAGFLNAEPVQAQWIQLTGTCGADVMCLASNGRSTFAGTNLGLFRVDTLDRKWTRVLGESVRSFAFSGAKLYAGTLESGVMLSTDEGWTWKRMNDGLQWISSLVLQGDTLIAGTPAGLYRSTDDGCIWKKTGLDGECVAALTTSESVCFAGTRGSGVSRSTDGGTSWQESNAGLSNRDVRCLIAAGKDLFAGTGSGLFRSGDSGDNWLPCDDGILESAVSALAADGSVLYAGTKDGRLYRSKNTGTHWEEIFNVSGRAVVQSILAEGQKILAGSALGIHVTTDRGANWNEYNTGVGAAHAAVLASGPAGLYAGMNRRGIFRTTDKGAHWITCNGDLPVSENVQALVVSGMDLYAALDAGIYRSTDGGVRWDAIREGIGYTALALARGTLFAGRKGYGILRSTDRGTTWTACNNGLTDSGILSLGADGSDIYAGAEFVGASLSTNGGESWTPANKGLKTYVIAFAFLGDTVYAGARFCGVYFTTDKGNQWKSCNSGLFDNQITALATSGSRLFAGVDIEAVFSLSADRSVWTNVSDGIYEKSALSLIAWDGDIYFSTSLSIWRRSLAELTSAESTAPPPESFALLPPNPNPFRGRTTVRFTLSKSGNVHLSAYDLLGREVALLFEGRLDAGIHESVFDAIAQPAGVYLLKLEAPGKPATMKVIHIR